jgi:hypothetical protein
MQEMKNLQAEVKTITGGKTTRQAQLEPLQEQARKDDNKSWKQRNPKWNSAHSESIQVLKEHVTQCRSWRPSQKKCVQ